MRYLPEWAHHIRMVFAAAAIVLGTIILIWWLVGSLAAQAAPPKQSPLLLSTTAEGIAIPAMVDSGAPTTAPSAPPPPATIIVHVSGAVVAPDVYELPAAARVKDLVLAAGGFTEDADPDRINLASRLSDEEKIHVPYQGEERPPTAEESAPERTITATTSIININTANVADIDRLPGVSSTLAERIVEYRIANGPFQSIADLENVKGIGPAILSKLTPYVTIDQ